MPLGLVRLLQDLKVINGDTLFTPRKKYCECDVKDKSSELSTHVTSIWINNGCLRSEMSVSKDLYVNRVTLTRMTFRA
jgi:hypothetical protein